ncbi:MAG: glutaredoxin family protein [Spirochaetes bacterium]|nr:glutaredoxin family protein [Spirochaetota bacterium]
MGDKLKLYALSTCIHCRNTRKFLDESGIDYDYVYVDKLADQERSDMVDEIRKFNPAVSFPTLVFGEKVVIGYRVKEIKEMLGI